MRLRGEVVRCCSGGRCSLLVWCRFRRRVRGSDLFLAAGGARRMVECSRCCCRCGGEKMEVWWFCSGGVKLLPWLCENKLHGVVEVCGDDGNGAVLLRWCCRCWCVAGNGVMVMQWWPAR
ncbi:hypothetical protein DEO72_LG3g1358 [Vigna unguiculata]|uniref:Uncharacterized protein n=1 Tax=Vigna unguiculata TaxID=3917 RepID=A0A4D6LDZ4_VIGUN|nr:hypothetical protein DEO72_LG3g1358 [Vigna unguiculata]